MTEPSLNHGSDQTGRRSYPGAPRWVKLSAVATGAVALLMTVAILAGMGGPHGPSRRGLPSEMAGHGGWQLFLLIGILLLWAMALNWRWLVDREWRSAHLPMMTAPWRKLVLVVHVASSVGALGAVAVFLVLAVIGLASDDPHTMRAVYVANDTIARSVVLPLLVASLMIGMGQALTTPWALLRHYWVVTKLFLTVVTIYVLLQQMPGITYVAEAAASATLSASDLLQLRRSMRFHAAGGLTVLLLLVGLSIFKPRGMTRYGWQRQHGSSTVVRR